MPVQIRLAEPDEAELVHALMLRAFGEYASFPNPSSALRESVADVRRSMSRGGGILAFDDDEPIASARFHAEDELELLRLAVVPEARGKGIGATIVDRIEAIAGERGYDAVRVYARSQQPDNRPWWIALGYAVDGYSGRYGIPDLRAHLRKEIR